VTRYVRSPLLLYSFVAGARSGGRTNVELRVSSIRRERERKRERERERGERERERESLDDLLLRLHLRRRTEFMRGIRLSSLFPRSIKRESSDICVVKIPPSQ